MGNSPHRILLHELQCHCCGVRTGVIGMDLPFSIGSPNLISAPIGQRAKNLSYIKAHVESEPFWQDIDQLKAAGIPNYRKHYFFRLNRAPLSFGNLPVRLKPYEFMVCIWLKP
jgi:hypothetical protein